MKFKKVTPLKGELQIPGDKSISHRSVMFGSIARGTTEISHFLQGADCLSTISCFQKMGVAIENNGDSVIVRGNGLRGLKSRTPSWTAATAARPPASYPVSCQHRILM